LSKDVHGKIAPLSETFPQVSEYYQLDESLTRAEKGITLGFNGSDPIVLALCSAIDTKKMAG
jgi:hypothetical protein